MKILIKKKNELVTRSWSGGTTTELMIFPEGSSYNNRDFGFRISTSTVDLVTSVFTRLEGISRQILVLKGELELEHEGQEVVRLPLMFPHSFDGGWNTVSRGRCTDFNLMTREGFRGNMQGLQLKKDDGVVVSADSDFYGLYVYQGSLILNGNLMNNGDFAFIDNREQPQNVQYVTLTDAAIVFIKIDTK